MCDNAPTLMHKISDVTCELMSKVNNNTHQLMNKISDLQHKCSIRCMIMYILKNKIKLVPQHGD